MCVNKSWIVNRYNGNSYFVNCGHCPACIQEKAIRRTNRIHNHYSDTVSLDYLFVTLTYSNDYIPYIYRPELEQYLLGYTPAFGIYRDATCRYVSRFDGTVSWKHDFFWHKIGEPDLDDLEDIDRARYYKFFDQLKGVKIGKDNSDPDKISVLHLADLQNFIKRFRNNLVRHYDFCDSFSYVYCGEYGPQTKRAHWHLLFELPKGWYQKGRNSVIKAWPYGYFNKKRLQRAIDPASYISSYLNCNSYVPYILRDLKSFRPVTHFSKDFGFGKEDLSLRSLYDMFKRNDFGRVERRVKKGVLTETIVPIPTYVLNRYFRKFKGFSRLTDSEISFVCSRPANIGKFALRIGAKSGELRRICNSLKILKQRYESLTDDSYLPFEYVYPRIWAAFNSYKLKKLHSDYTEIQDIIQLYDNVDDYLSCNIYHDLLDYCLCSPYDLHWETDPNLFPINLARHRNLSESFELYSKSRRHKDFVQNQKIIFD